MKILYISEFFYPKLLGGEARSTWELINMLSKKNYEFIVLTSSDEKSLPYEEINNIKIFRPFKSGEVITATGLAGLAALLKKFFFMLKLTFYSIEIIKYFNIDVVCTNVYTTLLPAKIATLTNKLPLITFLRSYAGKVWFDISNPLLAIFGYFTEFVSLKLFMGDVVVTPSYNVGNTIKKITDRKVISIHNWINYDLINYINQKDDRLSIRTLFNIDKDELFLLFVGALVKVKNLDGLMINLSNLKKKFKLVVIGEGPEKQNLIVLSKKLGIENKLIWCGSFPHDKALLVMHAADVLILPSKSESFSRVVLEALSLNTPVISTRVGGVPEMKSNNLYIVDKLEEIVPLLEKEVERKEDARIFEQFSMQKIIDKYEKLFSLIKCQKK